MLKLTTIGSSLWNERTLKDRDALFAYFVEVKETFIVLVTASTNPTQVFYSPNTARVYVVEVIDAGAS